MSSDTRLVLITGGTGKLGRSFLEGFARRGHPLAFTTRDPSAAADLCDCCRAWGAPSATAVEADLTTAHGVSMAVAALRGAGLSPSVLINNARNIDNLRPGVDAVMPWPQWQGEFDLGVVAPYMLSMALAGAEGSRLDAVINVASMYGVTAANRGLYDAFERESPIHYGVVKAALIHLTKELAVRLAPAVRVNAVSFGGVGGRATSAFEARYAALCPAGRMLTDADVFGPVGFLAGSDASGLTGHNLVVDGGWTIW